MATLTDDDLTLLLNSVDELVRDRIAPRAAEIDRTAQFPRDVYAAMAQIGLFGLWVPEEYDGLGWNLKASLLIAERVARASGTCALMFTNCGDATYPIVLGGSERVKREWLPRIAAGEAIPCFALTEEGAGSDAAAIATQAVRDGDGYRLSGRKLFCTNGSVGDVFVVFAKTDQQAG